MVETPVVVAVAVLAIVSGAVLGMLIRSKFASQSMKAAQSEARRIEAEARARQKELILEAKDEKLRLQREAADLDEPTDALAGDAYAPEDELPPGEADDPDAYEEEAGDGYDYGNDEPPPDDNAGW